MIAFPERELAIITPPHTASGNLHKVLCGPLWNGTRVIGPCPDRDTWDHHLSCVEAGWMHFTVALVVRHPLSRLVGLWRHWVYHQDKLEVQTPECAFHKFVAAVAANDWHRLPYWCRFTISDLVARQRIDKLIRFELLADDLGGLLGEPVALPASEQHTASWQAKYAEYDQKMLRLAEQWAAPDMERFGYDPLPPAVHDALRAA